MREVTQKELRLWYNQFHYFERKSPDLKSLVDHAEVRDIFKQMVYNGILESKEMDPKKVQEQTMLMNRFMSCNTMTKGSTFEENTTPGSVVLHSDTINDMIIDEPYQKFENNPKLSGGPDGE
jgi:hypothetical protein